MRSKLHHVKDADACKHIDNLFEIETEKRWKKVCDVLEYSSGCDGTQVGYEAGEVFLKDRLRNFFRVNSGISKSRAIPVDVLHANHK